LHIVSTKASAAALLRDALERLGMQPGDRLPPERELATELGISRPALREATRRLVDLGVLRARQGSGTYVAEVDPGELLVVRLRLEPLAAELAARHRSGDALAELERLAAALDAAVSEPEAFASLDIRLHEAVAEASGNGVLIGVLANLADVLRYSRRRTAGSDPLRRLAVRDLNDLVRAIGVRDAAAAGDAMRRHLRAVEADLQRGPAPA
jgi:DNA-binding FadR family transcriptional regulator